MTSNSDEIVQQVQHDFQNLPAMSATKADRTTWRCITITSSSIRQASFSPH